MIEFIQFLTEDNVKTEGFINKTGSKKIIISVHGMTSNSFKKRNYKLYEEAEKQGIDLMAFNNRGTGLANLYSKGEDRVFGGTSYEDPKESYYDIKAAIEESLRRGYEEIYLLGHSLGSTKVLYTYLRLKEENYTHLKNIKKLLLLALVDIGAMVRALKSNLEKYINISKEMIDSGNGLDFMPKGAFIYPVSAKTFYVYANNYKDFNFVNYEEEYDYEKLRSIDIPIMVLWGEYDKYIEKQGAYNLKKSLEEKVPGIDARVIPETDHSYHGAEDKMAEEVLDFINK